MTRAHPQADPARIASSAFLIWHLGEATVRLALSLPRPEADALVEDYKRMSLREVLAP